MNLEALPHPYQGLWLAHWCGLAGLAELPGQLLAGENYGRLAGSPATLAARLLQNAELLRQFLADWRPVLAAAAEAGEDWPRVLDEQGVAVQARLLLGLRRATVSVLQAAELALAGQPAAWQEAGRAAQDVCDAYLALAEATLSGFRTRLAEHLAAHALDSHETLIRLWHEAADAAQRASLAQALPTAYSACVNACSRALAAPGTAP